MADIRPPQEARQCAAEDAASKQSVLRALTRKFAMAGDVDLADLAARYFPAMQPVGPSADSNTMSSQSLSRFRSSPLCQTTSPAGIVCSE